jgi:ATP-dependent exoDNAse (exonuclease V) alpha subunit
MGPFQNTEKTSSEFRDSVHACVKKIRKNKPAMESWQANALIIDEISMLSDASFEKLNAIAKILRKSDAFFGGMQLVLLGDFFQLPPINGRFVFHSESWVAGIRNVVILDENMRQTKGSDFERCLNSLRIGVVDSESLAFLHSRSELLLDLEKRKKRKADELAGVSSSSEVTASDDEEAFVTICTTNHNANSINLTEYAKLDGREVTFQRRSFLLQKEASAAMQSALETYQNPETLKLRVGCRVMLLRNISVSTGLCNGRTGVVTSFSRMGYPVVRFDKRTGVCTGDEVTIEPYRLETRDPLTDVLAFVIVEIPLRLAWAMTIHKCQGMTLSSAVVDLNPTFAAGQAYVGLSRLTSAKGLRLKNWKERNFFTDPGVVEFYQKWSCP